MNQLTVIETLKKRIELDSMVSRLREVADLIEKGDTVTSCLFVYTKQAGEGSVHSYDWARPEEYFRLLGATSLAMAGLQQESD